MAEMRKISLLLILLFAGCATLPGGATQNSRQSYISSHPQLRPDVREQILSGSIKKGMTKEEVRASWGNPSYIDNYRGPYGEMEQWNYFNNDMLYFQGDKLDHFILHKSS